MADTHLGANPMGYQQQRGYPAKLPEIRTALTEFLLPEHRVDFVLHGGDMIDAATDDQIRAAAALFTLPVPVYLCLGNHDLTEPDAMARWMKHAPGFFPGGTPEYTITTEDCAIHVAPNHWEERPFYWRNKQEAHFSATQIERLNRQLAIRPHLPHLVLTHSPVYGLPVEQTGFSAPCHCPCESFTAGMTALAAGHGNLKCVLGAHNHMNMRVAHNSVEFVTVSSLVETPFEFKLFEVTPHAISMSTVALKPALPFGDDYNAAKAFVQGRTVDRSFAASFAAQ